MQKERWEGGERKASELSCRLYSLPLVASTLPGLTLELRQDALRVNYFPLRKFQPSAKERVSSHRHVRSAAKRVRRPSGGEPVSHPANTRVSVGSLALVDPRYQVALIILRHEVARSLPTYDRDAVWPCPAGLPRVRRSRVHRTCEAWL